VGTDAIEAINQASPFADSVGFSEGFLTTSPILGMRMVFRMRDGTGASPVAGPQRLVNHNVRLHDPAAHLRPTAGNPDGLSGSPTKPELNLRIGGLGPRGTSVP
jgi:hypothetical protein